MNRQNVDFQDSEKTLYGNVMTDTCYYTFVQTHRMWVLEHRVNPKVDYGLWVVMMCRRRLVVS